MIEDPLERLDREEREKADNKGLKTAMTVLAIVAVGLAAALCYIWLQKSKLVGELQVEKEELTEQIVALQGDYDALSSDYETINSQLDSSREEVALLVERIQKTDATNRAKMRQYEKELGTLRSIMRNYIVQIDSLNTLNQKLSAEASAAKKAAAESNRQNKELSAQVETLSGQVATGSVLKARGIRFEAYGSGDKVTDRGTKVVRFLTSLSLLENDLAPKGPVRVYIVIKDPSGNQLFNEIVAPFTCGGQELQSSASREVDYEGKEVDMAIYFNNPPECVKGIYSVEVYTEQALLGTAELLLR